MHPKGVRLNRPESGRSRLQSSGCGRYKSAIIASFAVVVVALVRKLTIAIGRIACRVDSVCKSVRILSVVSLRSVPVFNRWSFRLIFFFS